MFDTESCRSTKSGRQVRGPGRPVACAAPLSCSSTRKPVSPSMTTSKIPAWRVATTGNPVAPASMIEIGVPSASPEGASTGCCTRHRALRISCRTTFGGCRPRNVTPASIPRSREPSTAGQSGPSPIIFGTAAGYWRRTLAKARRVASGAFLLVKRPPAMNVAEALAGSPPTNFWQSTPQKFR